MNSFGTAFPDFLSGGRHKRILRSSSKDRRLNRSWRLLVLAVLFSVTFIVFEARLFRLSITEGTIHRLRSEDNRVREETIPAPRGIIFDRDNKPLTRNIPFYRKIRANCSAEKDLCEEPVSADSARLALARDEGDSIRMLIGREYLMAEKSAHLLGYVGEINKQEEKDLYRPGDMVGRGGIEEQYEKQLRGVAGKELIEVDAHGKRLRTLGQIPAIPGDNVKLTIDSGLEQVAADTMASTSGAIVATVPATGEVLALYSGPSFDPNLFIRGDDQVTQILSSSARPLFNRALSGSYPPGSTFKIVTTSAALEERKISKDTIIEDTGVITIGSQKFNNWYFTRTGKTEGAINIVRAITRSNDVFFYRVGELVGPEALAAWAKKFGLGTTLGIDLPAEAGGLIPDSEWKKKELGEPWYLGDTYHYAIGQGNVLATPLQVNLMTGIVANGGNLCKPRIVGIGMAECKNIGVHPQTLDIIKEGMLGACSPGGDGMAIIQI